MVVPAVTRSSSEGPVPLRLHETLFSVRINDPRGDYVCGHRDRRRLLETDSNVAAAQQNSEKNLNGFLSLGVIAAGWLEVPDETYRVGVSSQTQKLFLSQEE